MSRPPTINVETPEAPAWVRESDAALRRWESNLSWRAAAMGAHTAAARRQLLREAGETVTHPQWRQHLEQAARRGVSRQEFFKLVNDLGADQSVAADIYDRFYRSEDYQ